ncbi:MAG: hypothetical protein R3E48_13050 [Burkholderiaceae bacterium]
MIPLVARCPENIVCSFASRCADRASPASSHKVAALFWIKDDAELVGVVDAGGLLATCVVLVCETAPFEGLKPPTALSPATVNPDGRLDVEVDAVPVVDPLAAAAAEVPPEPDVEPVDGSCDATAAVSVAAVPASAEPPLPQPAETQRMEARTSALMVRPDSSET